MRVLISFLSIILVLGCQSSDKKAKSDTDLTISRAFTSKEKASSVLSLEGKEDVSHLLTLGREV